MVQIAINIKTLEWTMGETVGLQLMLKKNAQASVDWGDRMWQVLTGRQKLGSEELAWLDAVREYPEKGSYYTITMELATTERGLYYSKNKVMSWYLRKHN